MLNQASDATCKCAEAARSDLPKIHWFRRLLRFLDLGLRQTEKERLLTDIAGLEAAIARYRQNEGQKKSTPPFGVNQIPRKNSAWTRASCTIAVGLSR